MVCVCVFFILKIIGMFVELLCLYIEFMNFYDLIEIDIYRLEEKLL